MQLRLLQQLLKFGDGSGDQGFRWLTYPMISVGRFFCDHSATAKLTKTRNNVWSTFLDKARLDDVKIEQAMCKSRGQTNCESRRHLLWERRHNLEAVEPRHTRS